MRFTVSGARTVTWFAFGKSVITRLAGGTLASDNVLLARALSSKFFALKTGRTSIITHAW